MELTGLKQLINSGGGFTNSTGTQSNSKTLRNKQINNLDLPKYSDGTPGSIDVGSFSPPYITKDWGSYALTATSTLSPSITNPSAILTFNAANGGTGEYTNAAKNVIGLGPSSTGGGLKSVGANAGNIITSGIKFTGDAINAFSTNETGEEITARQGSSQMSIGGVGFESQNSIDISKELESVKKQNVGNTLATVGSGAGLGATVGSVIPGLGTAAGAVIGAGVGLITGIFGSEARKRKYRRMMEEQNAKINALQNSARYSAQTKAILLLNAREYGDTETLYLYGAKDGKQPQVDPNTGMSKNNFLLATPDGYKIGKANALTEPGETLFNTKTGSMMQVPRQIGGKPHPGDILPTEIPEYAAVFTDRHYDPITGKSFALAAIDGDDDPYNLLYRQKVLVNDKKDNKGLMKAKNGRLPKYEEGLIGNAITSGMGMLGGLGQWLEAKNSSPRKTNSYKSNEFDLASLDILSKLGVNPFPIMLQLRNAEARSNRAIDMSGGLTSGQRTLQRLASTTSTQRAIADALANIQIQNNNYKSDYAKTALATGAANAQRAMQAYQWDEDMYAKAHAARQYGMQMGMRNMIDSVGSYWQNAFKLNLFDRTMGLYQQDIDLRKDEINSLLNNKNNTKSSQYSVTDNNLINRASKNKKRLNNPYAHYGTPTYHNLSGGKWLAIPLLYQMPNIPKININTGKYM